MTWSVAVRETAGPTDEPMNDKYRRIVATNRKARHDYHIESTVEAGIVLQGTEVKSLREGNISFVDSYASIQGDTVLLHNVHISPYDKGNRFNHEPRRDRVLLLHKREINKLRARVTERGYTLVPLEVHFSGSLVKVTLGLARGKKQYDKRETTRRREQDREAAAAMRGKPDR